jgi:hypothetical protein
MHIMNPAQSQQSSKNRGISSGISSVVQLMATHMVECIDTEKSEK